MITGPRTPPNPNFLFVAPEAVAPTLARAAVGQVLLRKVKSLLRFFAALVAYLLTFELPALVWAIRGLPYRVAEPAVRNRAQYRVLLARLFDSGLPAVGVQLSRGADRDEIPVGRPLVVISRHAGFLNIHLLSHIVFEDFHRNPRVVSKLAMLADPGNSVLLRKQAMLCVRRGRSSRGRTLRSLAKLGAGMKATDAVVIFPEGANFTAKRRVRAIRRMDERQRYGEATRARARQHTLGPHIAGVGALITAIPNCDVVFVGHVGLEALIEWAAPLSYEPPDPHTVALHWWSVPAEKIPVTGLDVWLQDWWDHIDNWVAAHIGDDVGKGADG